MITPVRERKTKRGTKKSPIVLIGLRIILFELKTFIYSE